MRWLGFIDDPVAGGSTLEDLEDDPIPAATTFVPVDDANVDPGDSQITRENEVRGRRAQVSPRPFQVRPSLTFEGIAYPKTLRTFLRNALSGTIGSTGVPPAAVESTLGALQDQSGQLRTVIAWLLREGQVDRVTGAAVSEIALNFPIDGEGRVSATCPALYADVADPASMGTDPSGDPAVAVPTATYPGYEDAFMLRDAVAFTGSGLVELEDLAGFSLTFNNGLIDNVRSTFRPGHNLEDAIVNAKRHRVWYPYRHRLGPQRVTGTIDFSDVEPLQEIKRRLAASEKLVFEVGAGPLGTTPEADEVLRLTVHQHALTGGGAEGLQRDDDQVSSYEFGGFLDTATNKDIEATFVGAAALT
jgi:hypothetical protein